MHPLLFSIGSVKVHTYGFFVAVAFYVGIFIAAREADRVGVDREKIMDLSLVVLLSSIFGARLFYVLTNLGFFMNDPMEIPKIWNGGLVFYGGFILSVLSALLFIRKNRLPVWKVADITAPALALGHAIGRIGCFFSGCCHGKVCELPWAVTFRDPLSLAPTNIPLHPTQIYSVLSNLAIFFLLMVLSRRKRFDGQVFWVYAMVYGIARSLIEILRGDDRGGVLFETFSVSQSIGLSMGILGMVMIVLIGRQKRAARIK